MPEFLSAQYKFELADSGTFRNIGELDQARGRNLKLTHNKAGAAGFNIPMNDDLGFQIYPIKHMIKVKRKGSNGVWDTLWSGPVWTVDDDVPGNKINVTAVGWLQMLEKRILRADTNHFLIPDADIIFDFLNKANQNPITYDPYFPGGYAYDVIPGGPSPSLLTVGSKIGPTFQQRTINYTRGVQMLSEIARLCDVESGCDIWVDPSRWERPLHCYTRRMNDRTKVQFGYNTGAGNLSGFGRNFDPTTIVNFMFAAGAAIVTPAVADTRTFTNPTTNPPKLGENSQKSYGLFEETATLSDVTDPGVLSTYAGGEVLIRSVPRVTYSLSPFPWTQETDHIPEPFIDYTVGDKVYFSAKSDPNEQGQRRIDIRRQAVRIFEMNVNIDDNGNENLGQLGVSPA